MEKREATIIVAIALLPVLVILAIGEVSAPSPYGEIGAHTGIRLYAAGYRLEPAYNGPYLGPLDGLIPYLPAWATGLAGVHPLAAQLSRDDALTIVAHHYPSGARITGSGLAVVSSPGAPPVRWCSPTGSPCILFRSMTLERKLCWVILASVGLNSEEVWFLDSSNGDVLGSTRI
jgi:hypothetical protein